MTNQQRGCETQSYEGVHIPMAELKPPNKYAQTYAQGISLGQWFGISLGHKQVRDEHNKTEKALRTSMPEFTKYRIRQ